MNVPPIPCTSRSRRPNAVFASTTMLRPSGVSSGSEESCAASASCCGVTPGAGRNADAWRLPSVMVPVLSSSRTSTSPAASTARPDIAMTFLAIKPTDPGDADRREQRADGRGDQADEQRDEHGDRHRLARLRRIDAVDRVRQQRDRGVQEDERQAGEQDRERDLVRRLLPARRFDHRDHAVEEGLARVGGDADDQPVGEQARAAGDRAEVAARLADDRRRLAGDRALVDRADALDHLAVGGDEVAGFDQHDVAAPERRPCHLRPVRRCDAPPPASSPSPPGGRRAGSPPAPSRGLRRSIRRSSRRAR